MYSDQRRARTASVRVYDRWIRKFERPRLKALRDLKRRLEEDGED